MTKYVLNVVFSNTDKSADGKAKLDVSAILGKNGFKKLDIPLLRGKEKINPKNIFSIRKTLNETLKSNDILLMQYPTGVGFAINRVIVQLCRQKGIKLIALLHDIDSLRVTSRMTQLYKNLKIEANFLNKFDFVISSNDRMTASLAKNGLKTRTTSLEIFDYLSEFPSVDFEYNNVPAVNFAGNLYKSTFLQKYNELDCSTEISLFGQNIKNTVFNGNLKYSGSYSAEEIVNKMKPGFGLVWDGTSATTCEGPFGNYLKFNNPHKVSLYLAAGLPVIIWREASIAQLITENKVGVAVDSLAEIDQVISSTSKEEIEQMHLRALSFGNRLRNGENTKRAVEQALKRISESK